MLNKLVALSTEPPKNPVRRVTIYYVLLFLSVGLLIGLWPPLLEYLRGNSAALTAGSFLEPATADTASGGEPYHMEIALIVSMVGTLLLMLPVSWGYMGARRVTGFDQAVVQTVVILPMAVAGIVVMVKNSVALAFSLAGVVVSQFSQRHGGRSLHLSRHRCRTGCGHRRARRGSRHLGCAQLCHPDAVEV